MIRSLVVPSAALSLVACGAPSAAPAPARAPTPEPPPMSIAYRVLRGDGGDAVLLAGRTQIDTRHGPRLVAQAPHSPAEEEIELETRPRDDGAVLVEVKYEETSPEGAKIKWHPVVRLARGAPAKADVSGPGWSRTIEMTLE